MLSASSHLLGKVAVRARQAERQTGTNLVDRAVRDARRVCTGTSKCEASTTCARDDLRLCSSCTGRGNMRRNDRSAQI